MKKFSFLFVFIAPIIFSSSVLAFTVGSADHLGSTQLYLERTFLNKNVFPLEAVLVRIQVKIDVPQKITRGHNVQNASRQINMAVNTFLAVMKGEGWSRSPLFASDYGQMSDGVLTFQEDYSPKFILLFNGRERVVYYNPQMSLMEYFTTVNNKILRRLSNAGYIPYQLGKGY